MIKSLIIAILVAMVTSAQVDDRIVVKKSDLPPDMVAQLEKQKELEQYGEYVGLGKEIGMAINEGLSAVVDQAGRFSETNVGMFTMALIGWSIIGKDIVQMLVGIPVYFMVLWLMIRYYRKMFLSTKVLIEKKGLPIFGERKYQVVAPIVTPEAYYIAWLWAAGIVWTGISMAIIFV
jgi:hypothetical protein